MSIFGLMTIPYLLCSMVLYLIVGEAAIGSDVLINIPQFWDMVEFSIDTALDLISIPSSTSSSTSI